MHNHGEAFWNASKGKDSWNRCVPGSWSRDGKKCCVDCNKSEKCKFVCDKALPTIKRRGDKAAKEAAKKQANEAKKLEHENNKAGKDWTRIVTLCDNTGVARSALAKMFNIKDKDLNDYMDGNFGRYDYYCKEPERKFGLSGFMELSKLTGCSINKLLGLDYGADATLLPKVTLAGWRSLAENPPAEGQHIIVLEKLDHIGLTGGVDVARDLYTGGMLVTPDNANYEVGEETDRKSVV